MKIRWLGHSCFLLTASDGTSIMSDPFDETVGYDVPRIHADIVLSSHDHFDHNYFEAVQGDFTKVTLPGITQVGGFIFDGIQTYHDENLGKDRGENIMYKFTIDGITFMHCGDLGHLLTPNTLAQVGDVDVLFIPVAGTFMIDAPQSKQVVEQIKPQMVFPMHYKTPHENTDFAKIETFTDIMDGWQVKHCPKEITLSSVQSNTIVLMEYK